MIEALEQKRLAIQTELDAAKSSEDRNKSGQYSTPSALARNILAHAKTLLPAKTKVRFLDPALGSGAFFAALMRVFDDPSRLAEARAFEIDPHYGKPAQSLWAEHGLQVVHGDFTKAVPEPRFNLIICNPPYVRHHHIAGPDKARLAKLTKVASGQQLSGLAGLYCHFLLLAQRWMAPGAIAGWLIPSEFMDVNYGHQVKDYLLERVSLLHIHRFDPNDVQFADALVSSAVVWIKNTTPRAGHSVRFTYGGSLSAPHTEMRVASKDLAHERKWTRFPLQGLRDHRTVATVGDLFRIKRGLATGDNGFFVIDESTAKDLKLPSRALRPILPSPRYVDNDRIVADQQGLPTNAKRLFLVDPRMDQDTIEAEHPSLAAYLAEGKERGLADRYLCKSRKRWYDQEQREPAPIVCTYMGRGEKDKPFRFIRNLSQATVANSYLALYPTPALQARLDVNPELLDTLWVQLNAIKSADLLGEGRVYGGGLYKLEPKELANVPLVI